MSSPFQLLVLDRDDSRRDVVFLDAYDGSAFVRLRGEARNAGREWVEEKDPRRKRSFSIRMGDVRKVVVALERALLLVENGSFRPSGVPEQPVGSGVELRPDEVQAWIRVLRERLPRAAGRK